MSDEEEEAPEAPQPWTCLRISTDALREFVHGVCDGKIFLSVQIKEANMIGAVFFPVMFGMFDGCTNKQEVGVIWEWMSQACERSVNGMPTFFSCRALHIDDWTRARDAIRREMERRKELEI